MKRIEPLIQDSEHRMGLAVEHCRNELTQIRTGRASPVLLEGVKVSYYGSTTPLNTLATITAQEARLLVVQPFDKTVIHDIEKAIQSADLGLNPNNDGNVIRIPIPALTEERRHELVKHIHNLVEDGRVAIRNVRKDINNRLKEMEKNHELSEDEGNFAHEEIQKLTDRRIEDIGHLLVAKEKELLEQ
ncbi:MAG: ribosome recycling factor [Candidatus Neomarinimicrobiota bacterium]|nr:ribosome recycling factor [Candidatus Neomarinimicrobiota bacterium]